MYIIPIFIASIEIDRVDHINCSEEEKILTRAKNDRNEVVPAILIKLIQMSINKSMK